MNKKIRLELSSVSESIRKIICELESIQEIENEKLNNIPENLEGSEMYNKIEEGAENLSNSISLIEEACDLIEDIL